LPETGCLTLVIGGARSGKSAYAERLVTGEPAPWTYVATAEPFDEEMAERIATHRSRRGEGWTTVEASLDLAGAIDALPAGRPVLVDCLTIWLSNQMLAGRNADEALAGLAEVLASRRGPWVVVSNEVGQGIVPDNRLARQFRDAAGRLNQRVAAAADRVYLMVAGLPLEVK
jgi:adenosylcobinamide kinase / adenosylcobinamide-phosphate guanylyltransferase